MKQNECPFLGTVGKRTGNTENKRGFSENRSISISILVPAVTLLHIEDSAESERPKRNAVLGVFFKNGVALRPG